MQLPTWCLNCLHFNEVSTRLFHTTQMEMACGREARGGGVTTEAMLLMRSTSTPNEEASSAVACGAWAAR